MTDGRDSPAFRVLSDVVLAMAAEREVEPVLQRLVHAARELGGARYAALGVPDGEGAFARFITSGMSEALIEAMGPLPRTHGLLGAMLESPEPYRIDDIHRTRASAAGGRRRTRTCARSSASRWSPAGA